MKSLDRFLILVCAVALFPALTFAAKEANELKVVETKDAIEIQLPGASTQPVNTVASVGSTTSNSAVTQIALPAEYQFDPLKYTLGPDDVVEISVMRHPEFSGTYPINQEGKLQYKFVGDFEVSGLTKLELEQKIKQIISNYVISPEVNVTVVEYKSKVFYVLGEVGLPGKFFMRSESIPVREAVFMAGLPAQTAGMRKCHIITPDKKGHAKIKKVDLYAILYAGNLKKNIDMKPGDVLYVPSTVMAKIIRVISPVSSTVGIASSTPSSASSGRTAVQTLAR